LSSQKSRDLFFRTRNRVKGSQVTNQSIWYGRMRVAKVSFILLLLCSCGFMLSCWSAGYGFFARPAPVKVGGSELAGPNVAEDEKSSSTKPSVVQAACELIYQGQFEAASEVIGQCDQPLQPQIERLVHIVRQYKDVSQRRQAAREATYQEQIAELEKFKVGAATADANDLRELTDVNDIADANDANDISAVLSVIAKASEFADDEQRSELLSEPFVQQTFQKVIDKAAEFELKGKWLDAYTSCYYWLLASDPENEAYSDYAEQLIDKASIVASFQDSPCETHEERYSGVKKEMFIRAIEALNLHYVSIIDYGQMASKAIRRCELLAEVMVASFSQDPNGEGSEDSFSPPDTESLMAWSAALAALLDEVKQSRTGFSKDQFLEVFEKVLALNTTTMNLSSQALIAQFAEAALSALDPYTVIVWPRQVEDFEKMMTNEFTGIGIEISKPKGLLTVSSLLPGTPAYKSGLDAGDVIEAVDGVETKDMSLICAVRKITGPKGTKVTLRINRSGEEKTKDITIIRDRITVPTIRGWQRTETGKWLYMIDQQDKIGYVRITSFSGETASGLEKVLNALEKEGLEGLILDLRFNSGGLLDSAVAVADKFLEEGLIVRTQPGFGRVPTWEPAHKKGTHPGYPLVVLINSGSASGSEIVAGALADQEHDRAILVGQRTHGKGLVQGIMHLRHAGAQLKYTMAYYHLPSGQIVKSRDAAEKAGTQDWGIGPDMEVKLTSEELRKMLSVQRDNDILVQANRDEDRTPKKHTAEETVESDPQLAVGVLVVKAKLVQAGTLVPHVN